MAVLIVGLVLFLGTHSISIVSSGWRNRFAQQIGEQAFQGLYSLLSIAGFVLAAWGYGMARQEPILLYAPPVSLRHLALLLMMPVFPLLLAAYLPGRIQTTTKHPMLTAVKLWAVAHLLANGMLADVVLFGSFLAWAVLDRLSMRWRRAGPIHGAPPSKYNDLAAIVVGLVLYAAFVLWVHRWLIGVSPIG